MTAHSINSRLSVPGPTQYAMLAVLALLWGTAQQFTKLAVDTMPPATVAAVRIAIGAAVLYGFMRWHGEKLPALAPIWRPIAIVAMAGNVLPLYLVSWGGARIDSALATIILATSPLLVMTLGHFVLDDEKLRLRRLAGVAFGAVGIVILVGPDAFRHMTDHVWGQLAVFAAAICFAITAVSARGLSADQALGNATLSLLLSTVIICPMAVVLDRPWQIAPSMTSLMAVLWLSVLPMALATFIYLRLIAANGANFVSSKNFVTPVIGVIAGSFALGERLEPRAFVALAVIMIGIAIAESSRLKRR